MIFLESSLFFRHTYTLATSFDRKRIYWTKRQTSAFSNKDRSLSLFDIFVHTLFRRRRRRRRRRIQSSDIVRKFSLVPIELLPFHFVFRKRMNNITRPVLRATQNRLPLQDVSTQAYKSKLSLNTLRQQEQENLPATNNKSLGPSRPILTAVRSLKQQQQFLQENEQQTDMLISPMVKTNPINELCLSRTDTNKTREQLEQDLFEL